jgi:hypothetical protein
VHALPPQSLPWPRLTFGVFHHDEEQSPHRRHHFHQRHPLVVFPMHQFADELIKPASNFA